ncbi:MAG: DUF1801 domain-containing protein [Vicinamibacterales bacterium]
MSSSRTSKAAIVGVVEQGNAAVLVTVGPGGQLLDRRRVVLTEPGLPTHPYHHEGSWAVGRYLNTPGARRLSLAEAVALVDRVRAAAERGARTALEALAADSSDPITGIAIRAYPPMPPTTEARITDHRVQTMADSVMYRDALASAAEARGWRVHWYDRDDVTADAARVLKVADIDDALTAMGRAMGPPWQAAHKLAAAAALASMARVRGSTRPRSRRLEGAHAATRSRAARAAAPSKKPRLLAGGNPQIAKADGDAPVQAFIAAMPGWTRDTGRELDALITAVVPNVRKAVKWNSPFYGMEGKGWFLIFHVFAKYIKVAFFRGTALRPQPPVSSKNEGTRYVHLHEGERLDTRQLRAWIRQASRLPGWSGK